MTTRTRHIVTLEHRGHGDDTPGDGTRQKADKPGLRANAKKFSPQGNN